MFLVLLLLVQCAFSLQPLNRVLFDAAYVKQYGAYCLDGTPNGYFYRKSSAAPGSQAANSWVILLQGGGVCAEPIDCYERKKSGLGSSTFWHPTMTDDERTISDDPKVNPSFYNWNHVYWPYCTGDTHTGLMRESDIFGFYFSGHNSIRARIDHLKQTANLGNATHVLLSGQSAGGIGVFNNADYIKKQFSPNIYFKATPEAGYFFPANVTLYESWLVGLNAPYTEFASDYLVHFYDSYLHEGCVAANPNQSYLCWDASFVFNYIETDFLIVQNIYDSVQLKFLGVFPDAPDGNEYISYFGDKSVKSITASLNGKKPKSGYFMPACHAHTENLCVGSKTEVQGHKFVDIVDDWYWEKFSLPHRLVDSCYKVGGSPCNPTCGGSCG